MLYGDLQFIDILIFAGIAGFLIYRLRGVLGKREGFSNKKTNKEEQKEVKEDTIVNTPQLKENEKKLSIAYESMPNFDHKNFLEGAKFAFETIINAFNKSDTKTLKNLLTKEVYLSFEKAIESGDNNPNFQFFSLVIESVEAVSVDDTSVYITLKIISEQFKDNDESSISKKQDNWTFQKNIKSKSNIWLLSST